MSKSFVTAARNAVKRAGFEFVQMRHWNASAQLSTSQYRQRMNDFDIYVSLVGFRYGPVVRDDRTRSYAQLEFETAVGWNRPHYVIVINAGDYSAPHSFFVDAEYQQRQDAFRAKVLAAAVESCEVDEADQLEDVLFNLLDNPPVRRTMPSGGAERRSGGAEHQVAFDGRAALVAGGLGVAGLLVLWQLVGMNIGWAAGIAAVAALGTYLGGLRRPDSIRKRLTESP
jgi:hypothetical protein